MATDGLQLLMQLLTGTGRPQDVLLGMAIPQLPVIAKKLTMSGAPPDVTAGSGLAAPGGSQGGVPGVAGQIPPQLLPFLALAARAQQGGGMARPPAPQAMPRLQSQDMPL